jgi:hypothetical protein
MHAVVNGNEIRFDAAMTNKWQGNRLKSDCFREETGETWSLKFGLSPTEYNIAVLQQTGNKEDYSQ